MAGHIIDGKNFVPAMGYLALIWEILGLLQAEVYTEMSVVFEDVNFLRTTQIPKEGEVQLTVMVQKGILFVSIFEITYAHQVIE